MIKNLEKKMMEAPFASGLIFLVSAVGYLLLLKLFGEVDPYSNRMDFILTGVLIHVGLMLVASVFLYKAEKFIKKKDLI